MITKNLQKWNSKQMNYILDVYNRNTRHSLKNILKDPIFKPKYNVSLEKDRDLAYSRLSKICNSNIVSVSDFKNNPKNIFTTHEILGMCDGSLATKFTVQYNLFGGTVYKIGTDSHKKLQKKIDNLDIVGCFGLTELGYGNNAVEMETTAHYDEKTNEFIINTPSIKSQKYWITNGAVHAHMCVVFAQLIMPDGTKEGLHGFLVPIRDSNLNILPNVKIWDMGYKIGLNGIDNASIWFDKVRIPYNNLLNSSSNIINNNFQSTIVDNSIRKRKRFNVLADQLLSGRICIACMNLGATKMVLDTAIKYSHNRKTVDNNGYSTTPIIDYQLQKTYIAPYIAYTYAYNIFLNYVQDRYSNQTDSDYKDVLILACISKPLITWNAERTASICRERCGGQGFLAANRFGEAIFGSHAGITAEGDNRVILQKVTKELLSMVDKKDVLYEQTIGKFVKNISNNKNLTKNNYYHSLLKKKESIVLSNLAKKMSQLDSKDLFEVWMNEESNLVQEVALSYGSRIVSEIFLKNISENKELEIILSEIYQLYCINEILNSIGFYFSNNLISNSTYNKMLNKQKKLNYNIGSQSLKLIESFDIPNWMNYAPIANDWEKYNKTENNGEIYNNDYMNF